MSVEKVKEYFKKFDREKDVIELEGDISTVSLAASCLHVTEGEIAKTLSFKIDDKPILIVMKGDSRIDNAKYRHFFGVKAKMLTYEEVEKMIGHMVGGVCPFGINDGVTVYLDNSLKEFEYVYPACGSCNSCIKLSIPELEKYSNYKEWVDVVKTTENN